MLLKTVTDMLVTSTQERFWEFWGFFYLQRTLVDGTLHRNFSCRFHFKPRKSKVFKFMRYVRAITLLKSNFFWRGETRNYSQHLLNKELPGSQFLVSSTSELQSSIPKAQEQWKPKRLVTGGRWGAGDFEACKLSIPQGLAFHPSSAWQESELSSRGESKKWGFLSSSWKGRLVGGQVKLPVRCGSLSVVLQQLHLQLNSKNNFIFWWIIFSSAGIPN